ncbi:CPBP family intramembrane metalloprotease [Patescibacteria group bacterium]|nr:CPBP family intramembrane metalloprotease [Patescibacteria group bacterium]
MFDHVQIENLVKSPIFILLQTLGAIGPSLIAILLIRFLYGKEKLSQIFGQFKKWRVEKKWYFISILLIPFITLLSNVIIIASNVNGFVLSPDLPLGEMMNEIGLVGIVFSLPIIFVSQLFSSPLLEEFGWRGFALPRLQRTYNALGSSIILGLLWGIWHLPLVIAYGESLPLYLLSIIGCTILMTWVYNSTEGSLLMMLLFHASLNVSLNILAISREDLLSTALTWIVVGFVVWNYGSKNLSKTERFRWS